MCPPVAPRARLAVASGVVAGGMIPKVECCVRALAQGVGAAHIIDDTTLTVERQWSLKASLPAWAHEGLSPEEAAGETRLRKLDEMREKFARLAEIEEAEYKEQLAGVRAAVAKAKPEERAKVLADFTKGLGQQFEELTKLE